MQVWAFSQVQSGNIPTFKHSFKLANSFKLSLAINVHSKEENYTCFCLIMLFYVFQLLRIEEELGAEAVYAGASFRAPVAPY